MVDNSLLSTALIRTFQKILPLFDQNTKNPIFFQEKMPFLILIMQKLKNTGMAHFLEICMIRFTYFSYKIV